MFITILVYFLELGLNTQLAILCIQSGSISIHSSRHAVLPLPDQEYVNRSKWPEVSQMCNQCSPKQSQRQFQWEEKQGRGNRYSFCFAARAFAAESIRHVRGRPIPVDISRGNSKEIRYFTPHVMSKFGLHYIIHWNCWLILYKEKMGLPSEVEFPSSSNSLPLFML